MLTTLIEQEGGGTHKKILLAAGLSGAANAAILAIVNTAAAKTDSPSLLLFGLLVAAAVIFAVSLRSCVNLLSGLLESLLRKMRTRIADKIRRAELLQLESIGTNEIFERLTQQTNEISSATWPITVAAQSAVMLVFMVFYLAYTSLAALLLATVVYGATAALYYFREVAAQSILKQTAQTRIRMLDVLSDLLRGFKEVRFRTRRGEEIQADFIEQAHELEQGSIQTNLLQQSNYVFAYLCQFALLGAVVFILPQFANITAQQVPKINAVLIFLFGPIGGLLFGLPMYSRADLACKNVLELEHRLDAIAPPPQAMSSVGETFDQLELIDVEFERKDKDGNIIFAVGPINLSVRAGEIVFLVGGNGSGKTTLLRTMTGLYQPTAGMLLVNGQPVTARNVQSYRELLAAIFTDFHLFKKLYGLAEVQADKVQELLTQLEIADKTHLSDRTFSTVDLSTGQRKRIAMVVALLEDRPIYIFDEWAADQDPEFRRYFYESLLQELKRQGKAVIAISHDDRYFHCADRVVTLEYGKVRAIEQFSPPVAKSASPAAAPS